jgi:crossover junction endodeoxyribonuclease RusA
MKTVIYHLFVHGIPKPQPRPRMTVFGHVYNPDTAKAWKKSVQANFMQVRKQVITVPVNLKVSFFLPRPKGIRIDTSPIPHIKKPDLDNLLKATMDAMTEAGVWKDDALVFATEAAKWYAADKTGAQIIVETLIKE